MGLNTYQRNLVFTGGTVLAVGVLGYGAYILGAIHLEQVKQARVAESLRVENAKIADAKARVARVLALSICAPLDATEQTYLNNVEMDPEKTKQLLIAFHKKRLDSCRALMSGTDRERAYWDRVQRNGSSDLRDDEEPK